jgi:hypothetical protein
MLAELTTPEEMALLIDPSPAIPIVVLVAGDGDNVQACAGYTLEAWQTALERVGHHGKTTPCQWLVSNHSIAVSVMAINTEIPQSELPLGCRG